jgi:dienelactone hydrolase
LAPSAIRLAERADAVRRDGEQQFFGSPRGAKRWEDRAMRLLGTGVFVVAFLVGCGDDSDSGGGDRGRTGRLYEHAPPGELGKFPIGFVRKAFVDDNRPEHSTAEASDRRTLPTVVWYPAAESARSEPKAAYTDFFTPTLAAAVAAIAPPGYLDNPSNSVKDAPAGDDGPYPLIVFSHGNGGLGVQSYFLTEFLASHGYVVVCPDHTGNSLLTELPGGLIVNAGGEGGIYTIDLALADRPADVSFLVDTMTELDAADPDGRFTGKIDLENVGITGHSFGGLTTLLALEADGRFDVGAPMAPASPDSSNIARPVLYFTASEDGTLSNAPTEANFRAHGGPKMWIDVIDAGHFSFSNGCPLGIGAGDGCGSGTRENGDPFTFLPDTRVHAITNFYQTALWGRYLKGVKGYADDLLAQPFGADATIERDGMP